MGAVSSFIALPPACAGYSMHRRYHRRASFLDAQCVPHVLFLLALTVLHLFLAPCCRGLLLLNVFGRRLKPE